LQLQHDATRNAYEKAAIERKMQVTRDGYAAQVKAAQDAYDAMHALQGDWRAGAIAGMRDYAAQAANVFESTR